MPSDFADALGMTPALGTEPYLPQSLSPRYLTYQSSSPLSFRSAVVSPLALLGTPPQTIVVGGILYTFRSAIGETFPANPLGGIIVAMGPQGAPGDTGAAGPPGPAGVASSAYAQLTSPIVIGAPGHATLLSLTGLAAGTYLILGCASVTEPGSSDVLGLAITTGGSASNVNGGECDATNPPAGVLGMFAQSIVTIVLNTDTVDMILYSTTGCTVGAPSYAGLYPTSLTALQIA